MNLRFDEPRAFIEGLGRRLVRSGLFAVLALAAIVFLAGQGAAQAQSFELNKATFSKGEQVSITITNNQYGPASGSVTLSTETIAQTYELAPNESVTLNFTAPSILGTYTLGYSFFQVSYGFSGAKQFSVVLTTRTLSLSALPQSAPYDQTIALTATPSSGAGTVQYRVSRGLAGCSVDSGGVVRAVQIGSCYASASIVSDGTYVAASISVYAEVLLNFTERLQEITFIGPSTAVYGGSATLVASATSGRTVAFSSMTPEVCTISGAVVTPSAPAQSPPINEAAPMC
jgi:hypothetical protein